MLDVHAPHESTHTWTDFFLHIATIVVGLLIAIGLEQTVEYIHHRHQVSETLQALRVERDFNIRRFAVQTEENRRGTAMMLQNAAVLRFLQSHPHAAASQWPGHLSFVGLLITYSQSAWKTAQQSGVLTYMPHEDVRQLDELYSRLDTLNAGSLDIRDAMYQARSLYLDSADPAQLTPAQLASAIDHMNQARIRLAIVGQIQRNVAARYTDFSPAPTAADIATLMQSPPNSSGTSTDVWQQLASKYYAIEAQEKDKR